MIMFMKVLGCLLMALGLLGLAGVIMDEKRTPGIRLASTAVQGSALFYIAWMLIYTW